jgi:hypothetical protein
MVQAVDEKTERDLRWFFGPISDEQWAVVAEYYEQVRAERERPFQRYEVVLRDWAGLGESDGARLSREEAVGTPDR